MKHIQKRAHGLGQASLKIQLFLTRSGADRSSKVGQTSRLVSQTNSNDTQMVDHSMAARMLSPSGFDMQTGLYLDLLVEFWSLFCFLLLLIEISIAIPDTTY